MRLFTAFLVVGVASLAAAMDYEYNERVFFPEEYFLGTNRTAQKLAFAGLLADARTLSYHSWDLLATYEKIYRIFPSDFFPDPLEYSLHQWSDFMQHHITYYTLPELFQGYNYILDEVCSIANSLNISQVPACEVTYTAGARLLITTGPLSVDNKIVPFFAILLRTICVEELDRANDESHLKYDEMNDCLNAYLYQNASRAMDYFYEEVVEYHTAEQVHFFDYLYLHTLYTCTASRTPAFLTRALMTSTTRCVPRPCSGLSRITILPQLNFKTAYPISTATSSGCNVSTSCRLLAT